MRRDHVTAERTEVGRVDLDSGRSFRFDHIRFGEGHALGITERRQDGREFFVRVPLGALADLRAAVLAIVDAAGDQAVRRPVAPGSRGVPRGSTQPLPARPGRVAPRPHGGQGGDA